jgi:iron-sulfur cluster assembly accessory protein
MPLSLTETAAKEIKRMFDENDTLDASNTLLRVGVKGGGCSGFEYSLDFVQEKAENDEAFESQGVQVICDTSSMPYIDGTELDFKDELMGRGFVFNNPNATGGCGCGTSFSV